MAWSTPKTWVDNVDVLSASNLNTHIRDQFNALHTWASYTPTWTATGGTPTLGNGTLSGSYVLYGGMCHFKMTLLWGSTTTATSTTNWTFTMPTGIAGTDTNIFNATITDTSAGTIVPAVGIPNATTTFRVKVAAGTTVGNLIPMTWANTDVLRIHGWFQSA